MITKEKNRTKIICTVITAVLAAVTGGSVLRLYNVQNVTQTVNGNVIQILGETGSNISANMDLTDSTEELISEYKRLSMRIVSIRQIKPPYRDKFKACKAKMTI
ncbi:hypothetical protein [Ruminococcus sp.]|uniref:hypothetical protein n=1 Tax=Ruminococcus sp. TaxID=41978 RepID=UPI003994145A